MYRRILVALDPNGLAGATLPIVAAIARRTGASVRVVTVRDAAGNVSPTLARERVEAAANWIAGPAVAVEAEVRSVHAVDAVDEIVRAAGQHRADLVVLGSHARSDLAGLLLGGVAHRVAARVDCAVLLVRGGAGPGAPLAGIARALVGVDGTRRALAALDAAGELAQVHGTSLLLAHVAERSMLGRAVFGDPLDEANAILRDGAGRLAGVPGAVETRVLAGEGDVASQLAAAAEAWEADLVVLGSHRLTELGGLLLGSVAHGLVRRSGRPVLLAERRPPPPPRR